jgi:cysteine-rich repeat protein
MTAKQTARLKWLIILSALAFPLAACITPPGPPTAPGAPTSVTVGACSGGLQVVSWTAPTHNGGASITHYLVYRGMSAPASAPSTNASITCSDKSSVYAVQACNSVGCGSSSVTATYIPPTSIAGNGVVEPPEECDDGNLTSGDGCSSTGQIE